MQSLRRSLRLLQVPRRRDRRRHGLLCHGHGTVAVLVAKQQSVRPLELSGHLFRVSVQGASFLQLLVLTDAQLGGFDLIDLIAQQIQAALLLRLVHIGIRQLALHTAPLAVCRRIVLAHAVQLAKTIQIGQVLIDRQQPLVFVLAVQVNQRAAELAKQRRRCRTSVNRAPGLSFGRDRTRDQQASVLVRRKAQLGQLRRRYRRQLGKQRADPCHIAAGAYQIAPCTLAQHRIDRIDNDGFTGTGFARQCRKSLPEPNFGALDHRNIFNV